MPEADDQRPAQPPPDSPQGASGVSGASHVAVAGDPAQQEGLSWTWELDFDALITALNEPAPWNRPVRLAPAPPDSPRGSAAADQAADKAGGGPAEDDPAAGDQADSDPTAGDQADSDPVEAEFAELLAAMEEGRSRPVPLTAVAGRIAEALPVGPDLAGWLATGSIAELEDGALAGIAASYRRLASWAQAGELAVVAQLASRSAAADDKIGVDEQGRPARLPEEACAQVALALTMSQASASWWSDLAVTLTWRLSATGAALRAGQIDLGRARLIADATGTLDEETARAVEAKVLPAAGDKTTAQLRASLRRAVIAADPEGAERRREEAERRAKVNLYPDQDGTASLAGYSLPSIRAAAAMARISALAKAMKAAGAGGGMDLLRAQVFLGLLLGTLPYIPPAADGRPDSPPDSPPGEPAGGEPPDHGRPGEPPDDPSTDHPAPARSHPGETSAGGPPAPGGRRSRRAADRPAPATAPGRGSAGHMPDGTPAGGPGNGTGTGTNAGSTASRQSRARDAGPAPPGGAGSDDDRWRSARPPPAWPEVLSFLPPGPTAMQNLRPAEGGGLLDLTVPWSTLAADSGEPGHLSRIGPVTAAQARYLADLAARDAAVQWRVIVTDADGRARAVARVPAAPVLARSGGAGQRANMADGDRRDRDARDGEVSLVGRVTLTISPDSMSRPVQADLPAILKRALRAGADAAEGARLRAVADAAATEGCAHEQASLGYQPPPRLREFVSARDVTCRFPPCRQPVWRCDLDHSVPYDQGGRTCACNLGGLCRFHHQLKQHRRWQLVQPVPGTFAWITPSGRAYVTEPDSHAA